MTFDAGAVRCWSIIALAGAIVLSSSAAVPANVERLLVSGANPLAKAIQIIERRSSCAVTYEDPIYPPNVLLDWTNRIRKDGQESPKIFGPPERSFVFDYNLPPGPRAEQEVVQFVQTLVDSFNQTDPLGGFSVLRDYGVLHVVPAGSVLRTRVSLSETEGTAYEVIKALLSAVSRAAGKQVGLATVPKDLLMGTRLHEASNGETADRVLTRILVGTGQKLSWQLFYDYGLKLYGLNVHLVDEQSPYP